MSCGLQDRVCAQDIDREQALQIVPANPTGEVEDCLWLGVTHELLDAAGIGDVTGGIRDVFWEYIDQRIVRDTVRDDATATCQ